ncbi:MULTISPECIES: alpha/beta fold hydrolase [unclassified Streptomyces]|uniref:alpha/beta fold hydrolase n=1 Tax=unclassified Streptomyces TaxID=2593676 RepID=UPI0036DFDFC1
MSGRPASPRSPHVEALSRLFAEVLGTDRFGITDDFFQAGGSSVDVMRLVSRIRSAFGVALAPDVVFRNPTVLGVAAHLDMDTDGGDALDPLLVLRARGTRPPLFCVHPGGGMSWCYTALLDSLDPGTPLYGLQSRGLKPGDMPVTGGIKEMVDGYLGLINSIQSTGPYHLLGWSFGGTLAHALACRLQKEGAEVALLAAMDAEPTTSSTNGDDRVPTARELLLGLLHEFGYDQRELAKIPLRPDRVAALLRREGSAMAYLEPSRIQAVIDVYTNNQHAMYGYVPGVFHGDLHLFAAVDDADDVRLDPSQWTPYVKGEVRTHSLACTHRSIVRREPMAEIAQILNSLTL